MLGAQQNLENVPSTRVRMIQEDFGKKLPAGGELSAFARRRMFRANKSDVDDGDDGCCIASLVNLPYAPRSP